MTRRRHAAGLAAAICAGSFAVGPALAQGASSVSIYGLVDMSAGQFQNAGAPKVWAAENGKMSTSFLGFGGTEDLGGGIQATYRIEGFFRADSGASGRFNGDAFWARAANVGLKNHFGAVTLGRNGTPLFLSTLLTNAFGDSFGFSPSVRQIFTPAAGQGMLPFFGDSGWNNSVAYVSPSFGGLRVNLLANAGEGAPGSTGANHSASLHYASGPLLATAAWQKVRNGAFGTPPGWSSQDTFQLGAAYDFGVARLFGQYGRIETKATADTETTLYGLGASVPMGSGKLLAQYGRAKAEPVGNDVTNTTLSLGYDHNLSKRTDVYVVYMNDRVTGRTRGNTVAAGVRMRF